MKAQIVCLIVWIKEIIVLFSCGDSVINETLIKYKNYEETSGSTWFNATTQRLTEGHKFTNLIFDLLNKKYDLWLRRYGGCDIAEIAMKSTTYEDL